jgi:hypothetical protein
VAGNHNVENTTRSFLVASNGIADIRHWPREWKAAFACGKLSSAN